MNRRVTGLALAGALVAGGLGVGAAVAPALAAGTEPSPAATDGATTAPDDGQDDAAPLERLTSTIRGALDDLVEAGTIDADQADAVAQDLAEDLPGRGGPGGHGTGPMGAGDGPGHGPGGRLLDLAAAADALGISPDELVAGLRDGSSLAEIAEAEGVGTDELVATLVEAAQQRLDELVAAGELTQAEADERADGLSDRLTALVERAGGPGRGAGAGHPDPEASST